MIISLTKTAATTNPSKGSQMNRRTNMHPHNPLRINPV